MIPRRRSDDYYDSGDDRTRSSHPRPDSIELSHGHRPRARYRRHSHGSGPGRETVMPGPADGR
eukprot:260160-Hanusia_phi.AAC.1